MFQACFPLGWLSVMSSVSHALNEAFDASKYTDKASEKTKKVIIWMMLAFCTKCSNCIFGSLSAQMR